MAKNLVAKLPARGTGRNLPRSPRPRSPRPTPPTKQNNTNSSVVSGVKSVDLVPGSITTQESSETSISEYTEPVFYIRSRNIEFDASSLKPSTRFYPFFSEVSISDYIIPKLLEIEMISGIFEVGETVESDSTFVQNKIYFRLCSANHKTGGYNTPETFYDLNPYTQQQMPSDYSASSTFLNVDTTSLGLPSETSFYGCVSVGMNLIGKTSGAVARVSNVRLISDKNGRLIGSFFIPDASQFENIKFINGVNVFTLLDVESFNLLSNSESFAESNYTSSAINNITETNIITTRNYNIIQPYLVTTTGGTRFTISTETNVTSTPQTPINQRPSSSPRSSSSSSSSSSKSSTSYVTGNLVENIMKEKGWSQEKALELAINQAKAVGDVVVAGPGVIEKYGANPSNFDEIRNAAAGKEQYDVRQNPF
jgi:hypothetical protein